MTQRFERISNSVFFIACEILHTLTCETFCLLELTTLSILLSALLPIVFYCDNKRLLDKKDNSEEIAAPLSIATMAEARES